MSNISAELVMHTDRMAQHAKAVNESLTALSAQFGKMTEEQVSLTDKFKEDIDAMEKLFAEATKTSR